MEQPSKVDGVERRNDGQQDTTVVFLGAGRPARGDATHWSEPDGVRWGYPRRRGDHQFPRLVVLRKPSVADRRSSRSLMSAPIEGGTTIFVSYTDVVYGSEIVESLKGRDEDAVLVVDRAWRDRYSGRPLVDQMSAWARPLGSSSA